MYEYFEEFNLWLSGTIEKFPFIVTRYKAYSGYIERRIMPFKSRKYISAFIISPDEYEEGNSPVTNERGSALTNRGNQDSNDSWNIWIAEINCENELLFDFCFLHELGHIFNNHSTEEIKND